MSKDNNKKTPKVRFPGFTDDWKQRKLGEYVNITSGEAPSKFEVGTELYVKVDDLNYNDKYVVDTQNKVAEHSTIKRVTKGSVIFPKRGAAIMTNKVRILGIDSYMDTNMMSLSSEKLDSEFLYNIISKEGLYKIADTSTIPQINNKHIEPYEVIIPSLDEQKRIGVYFRSLDHLITLHRRKLEKLKEYKKGMLQKMFPKNGEKVPEVRFPGFTDNWEQRKLSELSDFITKGATPTTYGYDWQESGIPFFRNDAIKDNQFIYGYFSYISEAANEALQRSEIHGDDILVAITGDIGKAGIVPKSIEKGNINQHTARVRIVKDAIPYFVYQSLITDEQQKKYQLIKTGLSMPQLSLQQIRDTIVLCPSVEEQSMIGECFINLDNLITLHQRKLEMIKEFKKGCLQQMFV